ncbi:methyltransferase, FxLD system [Pseudonocardia kunmingensis]|uniref:Protein-L-isoaspartate O-methyltransferase n=1 Tax=Pseudonocardia kunmingensis TaxID=630975 RepID=A0A543CWY2_9PSEU|nr:methyltransferase, FxLD system [Pseudonocardia kunmingensis]TQM01612.1 protein-L-isoaspartate(D-aspartate) O-methyltransferase [Pseudonocardia kunmingensis]
MTTAQVGAASALVEVIAHRLASPDQVLGRELTHGWWPQSLAYGAAGVALLHVERARAGLAPWQPAHDWIACAAHGPVIAGEDSHLYYGAPSIAFAMHAAADRTGRYRRALATLDRHIAATTRRRLDRAHIRADRGERPALAEFDTIRGLTGVGAYLLRREPHGDLMRAILAYLVRLTEPVTSEDGEESLGWWSDLAPSGRLAETFPGGHANIGMAHGIGGPLALLSLAMRDGVTVHGQAEAIGRICAWLDQWRQHGEAGWWWPYWVTPQQVRAGQPAASMPSRPSWCYGTAGLARAQQLAALATGNTARRQMAEHALLSALTDPSQLESTTDMSFCHGYAGLLHIAGRAAADAMTPDLAGCLPELLGALIPDRRNRRGPPGHLAAGRRRATRRRHRRCPDPAHRRGRHGPRFRLGRMFPGRLTATPRKGHTMDPGEWPQAVIEFADEASAEQVAVGHLGPALVAAQADGLLSRWWFIRKAPCWRLRYLPADSGGFTTVLDRLAAEGWIAGWTAGIYEPETHAFGGAAGMDIAHELFHRDSRHLLNHLARQQAAAPDMPGLGRRELAILLSSILFRNAGQDWYEQGDVWARVTQHRSVGNTELSTQRRGRLRAAVHRLMTVDAGPTSPLVDGGPLAAIADWAEAFEQAGQQLAELARRGGLQRGLRAVLAHHVIFHWNRLGLPAAEQHILTELAKEAVMGTSEPAAISIAETNTQVNDESDALAERLRNELADHLRQQGTLRTEQVDAAVRAVPRHRFVPAVALEEAYADKPLYTTHDGTGTSISAASQPTIVAMMLEQLQVQPGQRVLELGAGTGYNAGLLAHQVGSDGQVITIDVDEDIVDGARSGLVAAGLANVKVILGDGALGYPEGAPYDRIEATVGAYGVPTPWLEQLAPDGRLVVPLRLRGSVSRSIVFERDHDGRWHSLSSEMCTFMPLRGIADDARRTVALTSDAAVTLQTHQDQLVDAEALADVLDQPRTEAWTGVKFRGPESMEWMDLWLACTLDNAVSRMPVERSAVERGAVRPQFGWGSMATIEKGNLAYLTVRRNGLAPDGGNLYETGVIGHGPSRDALVNRVVDAISAWDRHYRSRTVGFQIQATNTPPIQPKPGRFAIDTPLNRIVIEWH